MPSRDSLQWCLAICVLLYSAEFAFAEDAKPIDRRAVVQRHSLQFNEHMPKSPASLGNGEFAFSFDITGLQTFAADDTGSVPLSTMAQWAWHTLPESRNHRYEDTLRDYSVHGRQVSYATDMRSGTAQAIRANPHRFNLGRIGLRLRREDGSAATLGDLREIDQEVSLWTGEAKSQFKFEGQPVRVQTVVHPKVDAIAVRIDSPLLASGRVSIEVSFAYPAGVWGPQVDDWGQPKRHHTRLSQADKRARLERTLDDTHYAVEIQTNGKIVPTTNPHTFSLSCRADKHLEAVFHFVKDGTASQLVADFADVRSAAARHWQQFWSSGGAIDLSASRDLRWRELERRIVLSQFLTASHCAGTMPPQETGLMCNSWFGKSHLEMHWWHAAHFALWGRFELLERSLDWYRQIQPAAKAIAQRQGYAGVRWPKMTGPAGISSPSEVGELLIWQQPHPIYYAELSYRANPGREVLNRYAEIVQATAEFMADYAHFNEETGQYDLGTVLIPAQECYDGRSPTGVMNPTFELAYWKWGLQTANRWRERLGMEPEPKWANVARRIARPTVRALPAKSAARRDNTIGDTVHTGGELSARDSKRHRSMVRSHAAGCQLRIHTIRFEMCVTTR